MTHRSHLINQNIDLDKAEYEIVRHSILKNLSVYGAMTSDQLGLLVRDHLSSKSDGSLWRYYSFVREELELRGEIRTVPDSYPPQIEISL
jgi:hypothetical protein